MLIDDTVTQATFSIDIDNKGSINIRRPDGVLVQPFDAGVIFTDSLGARMVTIDRPQVGKWAVEVAGTGSALITAAFVTPAYLHSFDYVNQVGRPGHQGLFPIEGRQITAMMQTVQAITFGLNGPLPFSICILQA